MLAGLVMSANAQLVISEYVEATGNNRGLELWNVSGSDITFGTSRGQLNVKVQQFSNGSSTPSATILLTPGTVIPPGGVFVLVNTTIGTPLADVANQFSSDATWSGDDAVVLLADDPFFPAVMDSIGQVGFDPGTQWGTGFTSTADNTLRRKPGYFGADVNTADAYDPALAFDGLPNDSFNHVGIPPVASDSPTVNTLPATMIGFQSATLSGQANPNVVNTSGWFEWGTTTNYGNVTPAQPLGSGTTNVNFIHALTGLDGDVAYHFRAVAANSLGTVFGADFTFTTIGFQSIQQATNGQVEMTLSGNGDSAYLIEGSTNLSQWKLIDCVYTNTGSARFADPETAQLAQRFYRYRTFPASLSTRRTRISRRSSAFRHFLPPQQISLITHRAIPISPTSRILFPQELRKNWGSMRRGCSRMAR